MVKWELAEAMTFDEVKTLETSGESETLDFKESTRKFSAVELLEALLLKLITGEIQVGELGITKLYADIRATNEAVELIENRV